MQLLVRTPVHRHFAYFCLRHQRPLRFNGRGEYPTDASLARILGEVSPRGMGKCPAGA